jgi:dienelactone hydrolase
MKVAVLALLAASTIGCSSSRSASSSAKTALAPEPRGSTEPQPPPEEVHFQSGSYRLRGMLFRPSGPGPFPALVHNHGSEPDPSILYMGDLARWFQARGFEVLLPFRRGTSGSEGPYWKEAVNLRSPSEQDLATVEQLVTDNDDVLAAITFLHTRSEVDPKAIAVSGCSFGGIETVLTAERSPDVYAAVDFAGGSFTWAKSAPLRERMTAAVKKARVPIYFLQAENDYDTTPTKVLSQELSAAGKPGQMKIFPPHGTTTFQGHAHFCNHGMGEWGGEVIDFLHNSRR